MAKEEEQFNKMINTPVKKLILTLGLPTTISMLVTAIYNIADTYYVSNYDTNASAAVGVIFPLMAIIQAFGFMLGMGAGNMISSLLGMKKNNDAQYYGSSSFYCGIFIGILFMIFGLIFIKPLVMFLGAIDESIELGIEYGTYILIGAPLMIGSFIMNNILRSEGKARFSMIGIATGGILNIFLDPLFIYTFSLGVKGAAIATLISQGVSFIIMLFMFIIKKAIITLNPKYIVFKLNTYLEIIKLGFPSLCRQGLASIATILLNNQAGPLGGNAAISAMSITSKIFMVMFSCCLGIGQGYQPVCGYNYFAKRYDRVKEAMLFTFTAGLIFMSILSIILYIFSFEAVSFFTKDQNVIDICIRAVKYQCYFQPLICINVICNMSFQSMRKKGRATLLSCCKQGIFFIPLVFILPKYFGLTGVEITQAAADILTSLFSIPFLISLVKHLNKLKNNELNNY